MQVGLRVVLGVTGSIAAYKAVEVARLLKKRGADVQAMLTDGASHFVTALTFEAVTGRPARRTVWGMSGEDLRKIEHVEDAYAADRILIAPASANFITRYTHGFADDALTATLLSTSAPVWVAPAMESNMWRHPATQANVATLQGRGVRFLGPTTGDLASGRTGDGRMWAPERIVDAVLGDGAAQRTDLEGLTILVTAGPTWEPIDPVRVLTNRSTGAMGLAIADRAAERGARVRVVLGPTHLAPSVPSVALTRVESAVDMLAAAEAAADDIDVLIATAAVSDYRPADPRPRKLKRSDPAAATLALAENPDILATLSARLRPRSASVTIVGFAAETDDVVRHAQAKLSRKGCDVVIANRVGPDRGFGAGETEVLAITASAPPVPFGPADKAGVADFVLDQVLELRRQRSGS